MFLFWKRKTQVNVVKLDKLFLHKSESIYYNHQPKNNRYCIHTISKNVPLQIGNDGSLVAMIRYVGIPNLVVYFSLKITNIQSNYISVSKSGAKTIDIHVNAVIENEKCKEYKFELLPFVYQGGALACV